MEKSQIAQLVDKVRKGDKAAFETLYKTTNTESYFVALKITGNEDDAIDILQAGYITALNNLSQLKDSSEFVLWFNQILAKSIKEYLCKTKPELFNSKEDEQIPQNLNTRNDAGFISEESMDNAESRKAVIGIIDSLPEDSRLCVLMHYCFDMSTEQIADTLKIPESTVKGYLIHTCEIIEETISKLSSELRTSAIPFFAWLIKRIAAGVIIPESKDKQVFIHIMDKALLFAEAVLTGSFLLRFITKLKTKKLLLIIVGVLLIVLSLIVTMLLTKKNRDSEADESTGTYYSDSTGEYSGADESYYLTEVNASEGSNVVDYSDYFNGSDNYGNNNYGNNNNGADNNAGNANQDNAVGNADNNKPAVSDKGDRTTDKNSSGSAASTDNSGKTTNNAHNASTTKTNNTTNSRPVSTASSSTTRASDSDLPVNNKTTKPNSATTKPGSSTTKPGSVTAKPDSGTTKPVITTAPATDPVTTKPTTTKPTTTKPTTTKPTTTKPTTTKPVTTKPTTTEETTTETTDFVYESSGSGSTITDYIGSGGDVDIPSSLGGKPVTEIADYAFENKTSITGISVPDTVIRIGIGAFSNCSSLKRISLGSGLRTLSSIAFKNCAALYDVNIPTGLNTIPAGAFQGCSALYSLTVPSSVSSIGTNAFDGCDNLTIICASGSAAESYAIANGIKYSN